MDFSDCDSPRRPTKIARTIPSAPKKMRSGNTYQLNLTPRQLFKGDMTVIYHGSVRDITILGSTNKGLIKILEHASNNTNIVKYFSIDQLQKENPNFTYYKYQSVYDFDIHNL